MYILVHEQKKHTLRLLIITVFRIRIDLEWGSIWEGCWAENILGFMT